MKIAPIYAAMRKNGHDVTLVHTGQHYDPMMSDTFFTELGIPKPNWYLGVGGGSQTAQLAKVLTGLEPILLDARPDWVIVVGDVTSTLGAALVTAKLKPVTGSRLAHVEAGLRSNDWRMPEEVNRVLTDRMADLLLTPSPDASNNLAAEGISGPKVVFVGNVMIDTLLNQLEGAKKLAVAARLGFQEKAYALLTLHRPSNVDDPASLRTIMQGIELVARDLPVVFPVHPRTRARIMELRDFSLPPSVTLIEPASYGEMVSLTGQAALVLTDSGGVQEETTVLGVPCVTLREQTERPITVTEGTNRLVAWPPTPEGIAAAAAEARSDSSRSRPCRPEGWDGHAAERIVAALESA